MGQVAQQQESQQRGFLMSWDVRQSGEAFFQNLMKSLQHVTKQLLHHVAKSITVTISQSGLERESCTLMFLA